MGAASCAIRRQPGDGKAEWPFDAPFDMILNLAIGGDWAGQKGIDDAALPQRMDDRLRSGVADPSSRGVPPNKVNITPTAFVGSLIN